MQEAKVSIRQLENNTKVPRSSIQRMLTEPNLKPRIITLEPIAKFFGISVSQLMGEESLSTKQNSEYQADKNNWIQLPIISWEASINWTKSKIDLKKVDYIKTDIEVSKQAFGLVMTETMTDGFLKGAIIIFDPHLKPKENDYVLVYKKNSKIPSIKQLKIYDAETYLRPLNEQLNSVALNKEYKIIAVAKQIRFDFKK